jgi:4-hydroxy 2-oxovalerate aldolase
MSEDIRVLDCTLRDGGYYNKWDFPRALVETYLQAVDDAHIDAVEIGFRVPTSPQFLGALAYSTDQYLAGLSLPQTVLLGVMINARDILDAKDGTDAAVGALFQDREHSPVGLVRVAAHLADLEKCQAIAHSLKARGYVVGLNIMQVAVATEDDLRGVAHMIRAWKLVDVLYFADSLGSMEPSQMRCTTAVLREAWGGPVGVHAHDNKGRALLNTLAAQEAGATWLDATVLGMGRGAGNTQTEQLLIELDARYPDKYCAEAIFPLVMEQFEGLRREFGWGMNLLYYLAGAYEIHPTYIQEMLSRSRHGTSDLFGALEYLRDSRAHSFSDASFQRAMRMEVPPASGTWSPAGWAEGKDVLLLAPGPRGMAHLAALVQYIRDHQPVVLCLNVNEQIPSDVVTAYAACHPSRLLIEAGKYQTLRRPIIAPTALAPARLRQQLESANVLDYGLVTEPDTLEIHPTGCVLPAALVAVYAMAVAESAGAKRILMAGFDGYDEVADPRRQAMAHALKCYQTRATALPLLAVTPSSYDVPKGSIYAPSI